MKRSLSSRTTRLGLVALVTVTVTACGWGGDRSRLAADPAGTSPSVDLSPEPSASQSAEPSPEPSASPSPVVLSAEPPTPPSVSPRVVVPSADPSDSTSTGTPAPRPVPTAPTLPDLSAIEHLLDSLEDALANDADAPSQEGSTE